VVSVLAQGTTNYPVADSTITLNNSVPTLISTTVVKATDNATIVAPNSTAVLKNSLGTTILSEAIPSNVSEDIIAPDSTAVIKDSAGTTLKSEAIPSNVSENITINDSTVNVQKSDNTLINATTVKAEATTSYNVADSVVNVNSTKLADVKATDTLNITVVDSLDASVSVTLSGGNKIIVDDLPCSGGTPYDGALPLPTGDSTDLAATNYRGASWLLLNNNNPFGNTNRFTDDAGGQTYTSGVAIDWQSFDRDNSRVLGWFLTPESNTYANLIAGEPFTKASLSGWYVPTIQELFTLLYYGNTTVGHCLNYAPFNYIASSNATRIKTRTEEPSDTLDSMVYLQTDVISPLVKTQANNTFLRRIFTLAELGL
jgi:hypothetical protein